MKVLRAVTTEIGRRFDRPPYFNQLSFFFDRLLIRFLSIYRDFYGQVFDLYRKQTGRAMTRQGIEVNYRYRTNLIITYKLLGLLTASHPQWIKTTRSLDSQNF